MWHFDPSDLEGWFYYSGFVLSNIMLPILVVGLFVGHRGWRFRSTVSFVMLLHTASCSVLESPGSSSSIKIGYYLWLGAYGLLYFAYRSYPDGAMLRPTSTLTFRPCGEEFIRVSRLTYHSPSPPSTPTAVTWA
jgi:hypothetical protein